MKKITLTIDGKKVTAPEGETVLHAALDNGIYIPNLCDIRGKPEPSASCRLCFVEIEGYPRPVTACTEPVREGMVVNTRGEAAMRLVRTAFELLMASHDLDCANCPANHNCELQDIARHLKASLKPRRLRKLLRDYPIDDSHPEITYNPNRCVLCGRCIWACRQNASGAFGYARRGFDRVITTFNDEPIGSTLCTGCGVCVEACPTGAFTYKQGKKKPE
jgi:bidirectional [NiFe] hydrogenase diaphorase subunit